MIITKQQRNWVSNSFK